MDASRAVVMCRLALTVGWLAGALATPPRDASDPALVAVRKLAQVRPTSARGTGAAAEGGVGAAGHERRLSAVVLARFTAGKKCFLLLKCSQGKC